MGFFKRTGAVWYLWRSAWPGRMFDELDRWQMTTEHQQFLDQAIGKLSQSDPLVKLLQEVRLGRMRPTDAGLQAITESWLETYRQVLQGANDMDAVSLRRLDPSPRLEVLISAGILASDHPAVLALRTTFEQKLAGLHA